MQPELARVEDLLSDAAVEPDAWPRVLAEICSGTTSFGALMLPVTAQLPGIPVSPSIEPFVDTYFGGGWHERDERLRTVPQLLRTGVAFDQDFVDAEEMRRHPFWQDFLERIGLRWFGGVRVRAGEDLWCLALQRTPDQGRFTAQEQDRLRQLIAPLSRAATLTRRLAEARLEGLSDALHLLDLPGFVVDRHGRIVRCNVDAEAVLATGVLALRRGELTAVGRPDLTTTLRRHLEATVSTAVPVTSPLRDGVAVPRAAGSPLFLQAHPLRRELARHFMPGCALLLATDPDLRPVPGRPVLRALFELTEREVQLVQALAAGHTLAGAALQAGVTYETARTYLKSVFAKTGAHGQSELVAIAARLGRR